MTRKPVAPTQLSVAPSRAGTGGLTVVTNVLAGLGSVFLVWQVWTLTAWLLDHPHQITQFRDPNTASFWIARVLEVIGVIVAVLVIRYAVQDCRRAGRLTFDAKLVIAALSAAWLDPTVNAMAPVWFYSSNFVNLNAWTGNMPFIINPDAGRLPEPVLLIASFYLGMFPVLAFLLNRGMRFLQRRNPDISAVKLMAVSFVTVMVGGIAFSIPMYFLRLVAAPGSPEVLSVTGGGATRYPILEPVIFASISTGLAMARWLKDDRGNSLVVEQHPPTRSPLRAQVISLLALIGLANILLFAANSLIVMQGFFASPYNEMPAHLVNEMCDAPGYTDTVYGPCPGSPGFKMPIRELP
ncbi:spirocyclase AveC family protein [Mycobacterium sp. NAZ190054]|uniref:spirocyclase AveC family protein n=1 Tax=Mycobacterium sp. NAZ190054 TaxID=1747766 RepID=UPI000B11571B|nr:spirocyclase AveC family protein [Mycobacterium sp. NAZ190054]